MPLAGVKGRMGGGESSGRGTGEGRGGGQVGRDRLKWDRTVVSRLTYNGTSGRPAPEGARPCGTLVPTFWPPELVGNKLLLL